MRNEVQVWFQVVDQRAPDRALLQVLDDEERVQAGRFRFERDRARFVARRAFRRRVLAHYLEIEPGRVRIRTAAKGRPEVDSPDEVMFSTAHADGLAVVAVARGRRVGVDLERIRPIPEAQELAGRLYSPRESGYIRSVGAAARSQAFLALWTRKESVVKAVGEGLSMPFDRFEVLIPDGSPGQLADGLPFVLSALDDMAGYVGAVAVAGTEVVALRLSAAARPS